MGEDWDPECYDFTTCAYGCAAYYGDRATIADKAPPARYDFIKATRDKMYGEGITQEKRCDLMMCHSYCAKRYFNTCRETQFRQQCEASQPSQYGCDVKCGDAHRSSIFIAAAVMLFLFPSLLHPR